MSINCEAAAMSKELLTAILDACTGEPCVIVECIHAELRRRMEQAREGEHVCVVTPI